MRVMRLTEKGGNQKLRSSCQGSFITADHRSNCAFTKHTHAPVIFRSRLQTTAKDAKVYMLGNGGLQARHPTIPGDDDHDCRPHLFCGVRFTTILVRCINLNIQNTKAVSSIRKVMAAFVTLANQQDVVVCEVILERNTSMVMY